MAFGKLQMMRFRLMNQFFTSKQKEWTRKQLKEELAKHGIKISERSLTIDLDLMKGDEALGYLAPIEYCDKKKRFYYSDPDYSFEKLPLSSAEYQTLLGTLSLLKFKFAFKDFESLLNKVATIGSESRNLDTNNIVGFEKAPSSAGEIHIDRLRQAIRAKQPLHVRYKKFTSENSSIYSLHPYYLKEYKHLWYLLCYNEEAKELRTFALDRMIEIEDKETDFIPSELPHPEDYFKDIVGITKPKGEVHEIVLRVDSALIPYIKTQPLHHSQDTLSESKEEMKIRITLIPNYELYSNLLGFGKKIKVISPAYVIEEMQKI